MKTGAEPNSTENGAKTEGGVHLVPVQTTGQQSTDRIADQTVSGDMMYTAVHLNLPPSVSKA